MLVSFISLCSIFTFFFFLIFCFVFIYIFVHKIIWQVFLVTCLTTQRRKVCPQKTLDGGNSDNINWGNRECMTPTISNSLLAVTQQGKICFACLVRPEEGTAEINRWVGVKGFGSKEKSLKPFLHFTSFDMK